MEQLTIKPRFGNGFDLPEVNFLGKSSTYAYGELDLPEDNFLGKAPAYDVWVNYISEEWGWSGLLILLEYGNGDFEFKEVHFEALSLSLIHI